MDKIEQEINRKISVREFAFKNSSLSEEKINFNRTEEDNSNLFNKLQEPLIHANNNWYNTDYRSIHSHRKLLGPCIVFVKKVIRKIVKIILGWYINPIIQQQNQFNADIVNSINILKDMVLINSDNEVLNKIRLELESKQEVINNKNDIISKYSDEVEGLKNRLEIYEKRIVDFTKQLELGVVEKEYLQTKINEQEMIVEYIKEKLNISCDIRLINNLEFDYFKFENRFRGTREEIKQRYIDSGCLSYFENKGGYVLDIGCGRGEFLELLEEKGVKGKGIDSYAPFVKYCTDRCLEVVQQDALTFLTHIEDGSLDGIFMSHVIEHLSKDYLITLIRTAYRKLKTGCYFILDTPNPEALSTYRNFYIDLDHVKPIPYLTLEYLFKDTGYEEVKRYDNPSLIYFDHCYHIESDEIKNLDECNHTMDLLNNVLFSSADYMLIAKK